MVTAVAQVHSLAWEHPHAAGMAKIIKQETKTKSQISQIRYRVIVQEDLTDIHSQTALALNSGSSALSG
ncbi:hypothetical protein PSW58_23835, partial [Shigella flexneri]|nr:hypothetical protein [Shigella flexneri]